MLSEHVRQTVLNTTIGHREPEFSELLFETANMIKPIVGIDPLDPEYEAAFITGSGTAANETVLSSIGTLGRVLVVSNGEFGERLLEVLKLHNQEVDHLGFNWQEPIDLRRLEQTLSEGHYRLVAMVHHETSTGMLNPVAAVAKLAHRYGALISVDTISSIGAETIEAKKWDVDVLVGTSGKALSAMPGVGILIVKNHVLELLEGRPTRGHYLDLRKHFTFIRELAQTPNTPAVHVFVSLHASLNEIHAEGLQAFRSGIRERADYVRQQINQLGLTYADYGHGVTSKVITCVTLPDHITFQQLAAQLKQQGIVIYNGKGPLKDKIFQIGHIGALRKSDTLIAMSHISRIILGNEPRNFRDNTEIALPVAFGS
jgi:2-aminoethylphosphonate-pyruvate transaminase